MSIQIDLSENNRYKLILILVGLILAFSCGIIIPVIHSFGWIYLGTGSVFFWLFIGLFVGLWGILQPSNDLLNPLRMMSLIFLLSNVLIPAFHVFTDFQHFLGRHILAPNEMFVTTLAFITLAQIVLVMGYRVQSISIYQHIHSKFSHINISRNYLKIVIIIYLLIGAYGAYRYVQSLGGLDALLTFSGSRNLFYLDSNIGKNVWFEKIAMLLVSGWSLLYAFFSNKRKIIYQVIIIFTVIPIFFYFIVLQGRFRALVILMIFVIMRHYLIKRIQIWQLLVLPLILLLLTTTLLQFRSGGKSLFVNNPTPAVIMEALTPDPEKVQFTLLGDFSKFEFRMASLEYFPRYHSFSGGARLIWDIPLVPAILLRLGQRPPPGPSVLLNAIMFNVSNPASLHGIGFAAGGLFSELYIQLGMIGVLVGFGIFGWLLGLFYRSTVYMSTDPVTVVLYATMLPYLLNGYEGGIAGMWGGIWVMIPIILALFFCRKRDSTQNRITG